MESGNYGDENCAISILNSVQLDVEQWRRCVGDPDANERNAVLEQQQEAQVGTDGRSDVSILPTVVINNEQYRGKIISSDILQAICAGFAAGTEPEVCGGADACDDGGGAAECAKKTDTGHTSCQTSGASYKCVCPVGTIEVKKRGRDFELPGHQRVPHRDADGRLVHVRAVLVQVGAPPRQRRDVYVPRGAALGVRRRGHRAPGRMLVREGIHRLRRRHRRQEASRDKGSPTRRPSRITRASAPRGSRATASSARTWTSARLALARAIA